jgi:ATP-dependent Lhr-like helicase
MVFELFNEELQKIVRKRFAQPTLPQRLGIPPILEGKNVLLIAPTGTGKTESGMLPIFDLWMKKKPEPISILYITPLRALNRDLSDRLNWWAEEIGIDISVRHGDTTAYVRKMQVEVPPDMLIVTPETLQAILPAKRMKEHLKNIKWCIVDEVHELVSSKRGTQLSIALERLRELTQTDFQIIGLSATIGNPKEVARFLVGNRPVEIIKATTSKQLEIRVISPKVEKQDTNIAERIATGVETASRIRTISNLIRNHKSTLIFTNTRDFAEILSSRLRVLDPKVPIETHHSSLSKEVRVRAEKEFKKEALKSLVATSSLELGIDIGSIDYIIQYMSPRQTARIVQRIGRSGHKISRTSEGVIITTDEDDVFEASVIARRALNEELEPSKFHEGALDVLAHQLVGLTMDNYIISTEKAYQIIKRAYPYRSLSKQQFLEVCKQLMQLGLVWFDGHLKKRRAGLLYYFTNLSTIPDVRNFIIIDNITGQPVGTLDEEFVVLHGEPNTTFIVKGEPWRIVSIDRKRIFVEPSSDIEAAIPGWEGELIPVPYEVAKEVGELRRWIAEELKKETSIRDLISKIKSKYPVDENSAKRMIKTIKEQMKFGVVPDNKTILIEDEEDIVVIHTCFGSKVNETLGRLLTVLLSARLGTVGLRTDPYRIILKFRVKDIKSIKDILLKTNPDLLKEYIELELPHSELFQWKFIHVAKRFGAIRKDADYSKVYMKKIVESCRGTPLFKETLREIEVDKLDIPKAREVLRKIQNNEIQIIYKKGLSFLGKLGIKYQKAELIGGKPSVAILELFKERINKKEVKLVCMNCGQWSQTFLIKDMPNQVMCKRCRAKLLGVTTPTDTEVEKIIRKKLLGRGLSGEELKKFEKMKRIADLYIVYGKKVIKALSVRGIGPETAVRILAKMYLNEDEFYLELLNAQREWIRTRKYWS